MSTKSAVAALRAVPHGTLHAVGSEGLALADTRPLSTLIAVALPCAAVLAAFLFRLLRLGYFNLSGDEAVSATFSAQPLHVIFAALRTTEPHPPLAYLLYHFWIPLAGDGEVAMRLVPVVAGTATVALAYATGARLFSRPAGLVAVLVMTISPYQLWNDQDARMYAPATCFALGALYASARALGVGERVGADDRSRGSGRLAWTIAYVVWVLLALFTHLYSVFTFLAINAFAVVWIGHRRSGMTMWLLAQLVVMLTFVPWLVFAWHTLNAYTGTGDSPPLWEAAEQTIAAFTTGYLYYPTTSIIAWLLFGAAAAGTCFAWRTSRAATALVLSGLLLPTCGVILASLFRPVFNERYLMMASPEFVLLVGAVVLGLTQGRRRSVRALSALAVGLVAATGVLMLVQFETATKTIEKARDAAPFGQYVASLVTPSDRVLFNTLDPTFAYYYHRANGSAPSLVEPQSPDESLANVDRELAAGLAGADQVYVVPDGLHKWDVHDLVPSWLARHLVFEQDQRPEHQIVMYRTIPMRHRLNVGFGPAVRLVGTDVPDGEVTNARSALAITLLWQTAQPLTVDYMVSVQLLDGQGKLVTQQDGPPQKGAARTPTWRTTETIPDVHTLQMPTSSGTYTLAVAVYDLATLQRLPVSGQANGLARIGTVHVASAR